MASLDNKHAVVVFSGGQDSTTCLFWALEQFEQVTAVTFDYGQRNAAEIEQAVNICKEQGVKHHILDLSLLNKLSPSAMTRDIDIAHSDETGLPNTFVPGRNHLFLSFAAVFANNLGAKHIVTGVCETDFSGYPDCRNNFIMSLNVTLNLAMEQDFVIHTPLMWMTKADTWALADRLGKLEYIKTQTVTCYNGIIGDGCGSCPSCELRRKGYEAYLQQGERQHA